MKYEGYKDWQVKYIEYKSILGENYTDLELVKKVGVSRQSISDFKSKNPQIFDIIRHNLTKQIAKLGNKALQCLYNRMPKSDKCVQMGLEIAGIYTPKQEQVNRYETVDVKDNIKEIQRKLRNIIQDK